jgi:benzodiazapine receptor
MMKKDTLRQSVNLLAVIATIAINGLANALPLNGQTTGEISDRFQVYFVPAGYVFSIWGLIYVALVAFAVYQALPAQRDNPRLHRIGYLFALSCVANIAWLFLWHYEIFTLTLVAMLALLLLLIAIYLRLDIGRAQIPTAERWLVHILFSIYLGWITVATIANVTSLLDYLKWSGWGISPEAWTIIMLAAGVGIASAVSLTRGDVAYMLVIVWAFAGIAVKHAGTPVVATAAWVATALVAVMLVAGMLFKRRQQSFA